MKRIFFFSNVLTNYQFDFLKEINKNFKIFSIFEKKKFTNFKWNFDCKSWIIYLSNYEASFAKKNIIEKKLNSFKPNMIILGGYRLDYINYFIKWAEANQVKYYYWFEYPDIKSFFKKIVKILIFKINISDRLNKNVLAVGKKAKNFYSQLNFKTTNFPYSIDLKMHKKKINKKKINSVKFLYVGQLIKRKNISELLYAFNKLNNINCSLTLVGEGPLKSKVLDYCKSNKNIAYQSFLDQKKLVKIFNEHHVLVLPSRFDGWGVVVTQAMAAGLAIIGSDNVGAINEYIRHGINGRVCEPNKISIFKQLNYYIAQKKKINEHGTINRKIIFDSLSNVKNAIKLLNKI
jgi:glycosyltransferase involved in cell wall biosynthesis